MNDIKYFAFQTDIAIQDPGVLWYDYETRAHYYDFSDYCDEIKNDFAIFGNNDLIAYYPGGYSEMTPETVPAAWENKQICGSVQAEWNNLYYNSETVTDADIEMITALYYNTGSEWWIYEIDADDIPDDMPDGDDADADDILEFCKIVSGHSGGYWYITDSSAEKELHAEYGDNVAIFAAV